MKIKWLLAPALILALLSCRKEDVIPVEEIQLSSDAVFIKVGESVALSATFNPVNATNRDLNWSSGNESVVTVDGAGNLHGVSFGSAFVVASAGAGEVTDSCEVFVNGTLTGESGSETISMGSGYANDIFYSLKNGVAATVPRTNWDIAFQTGSWSSTIIINSGAGVRLFAYPGGDISAWGNVNITGIESWKAMNNSDTTWVLGAFERYALGHPDYGWGIYNSLSHDVVGDSIFIIQLQDQSYRKLAITRKVSVDNKYIFRFAMTDGSGEITDTVDCKPYSDKNFVYYSFSSRNTIDREPPVNNWDFLVTRYLEFIPDGTGGFVPYPVIGILSNSAIRSAQMDNVDPTVTDYTSANFVTAMNEIGSDWKSFNMNLNQWTVLNNRVYYIKDRQPVVFKIVFKSFSGSQAGLIGFDKAKLN